MQTPCFELRRRGIGSRPVSRLRVEEPFQTLTLQRPIREPIGGQNRNGQLTPRAAITLHLESLPAAGPAITAIETVAMDLARTPARARRPLTRKRTCSDLNPVEKPDRLRHRNDKNSPCPQIYFHDLFRRRSLPTTTKNRATAHNWRCRSKGSRLWCQSRICRFFCPVNTSILSRR